MITVCACESQPILIEGLRAVLEGNEDIRFLGAVTNPWEVIGLVKKHTPTVCLIDSTLDDAGLRLITEMRQHSPESKPVLWTDDIVGIESFRALQVGVRGILKKTLPAPAILECLWAVGHGNIWIERTISHQFVGFISGPCDRFPTGREQEILRLIMRSKTNREIATALSISVSTVKLHLLHMFEKAGVRSRLQLALQGLGWRDVLLTENEDDPPLASDSPVRTNAVSWRDSAALTSLAWPVSRAAGSLQPGPNARLPLPAWRPGAF